MKTNRDFVFPRFPRKPENLLRSIHVLLDTDLSHPRVERTARELLKNLRKRGYAFHDSDLQDPDCLMCLFEALHSAAEAVSNATLTQGTLH